MGQVPPPTSVLACSSLGLIPNSKRRRWCCAVQKPREQALDSELFAFITEVGSEHVTKLARGGKVSKPKVVRDQQISATSHTADRRAFHRFDSSKTWFCWQVMVIEQLIWGTEYGLVARRWE